MYLFERQSRTDFPSASSFSRLRKPGLGHAKARDQPFLPGLLHRRQGSQVCGSVSSAFASNLAEAVQETGLLGLQPTL